MLSAKANKSEPAKTGHSRLPWIAFDEGVFCGNDCIAITDTSTEGQKTDFANAAFIVRACNAHYQMLEALKAALADIEAGGHLSVPMIRAAIAAAEAEGR